jgi:hypothetical protein
VSYLSERITELSTDRMNAVCEAITITTDC